MSAVMIHDTEYRMQKHSLVLRCNNWFAPQLKNISHLLVWKRSVILRGPILNCVITEKQYRWKFMSLVNNTDRRDVEISGNILKI